jgi:hypothetical protein
MTFQNIRIILGFFVGYATLRFGIPIFFTWLVSRVLGSSGAARAR